MREPVEVLWGLVRWGAVGGVRREGGEAPSWGCGRGDNETA